MASRLTNVKPTIPNTLRSKMTFKCRKENCFHVFKKSFQTSSCSYNVSKFTKLVSYICLIILKVSTQEEC